MPYNIDWDAVGKVFTGAGVMSFIGVLVNKVLVSGDKKVEDRRIDKDDVRDVLRQLNAEIMADLKKCEEQSRIDSELRHWRVSQIQVLAACFERLREAGSEVAKLLRGKKEVPDNLLAILERGETSFQILERVIRINESTLEGVRQEAKPAVPKADEPADGGT